MPHKDLEAKKAYMRERYQRKAEEIKAYQKQYRSTHQDQIREARKDYLAAWHRANRERRAGENRLRRLSKKAVLVKMAGGACGICGFNSHLAALEFHHRDPATKTYDVNIGNMGRSLENLMTEAAKCDLLCANCHGELHSSWSEVEIEAAMGQQLFGAEPEDNR